MSEWNLDKDIWWVRHGESSSNLHENAIEDQYEDVDVEKAFQVMRNKYKHIENDMQEILTLESSVFLCSSVYFPSKSKTCPDPG